MSKIVIDSVVRTAPMMTKCWGGSVWSAAESLQAAASWAATVPNSHNISNWRSGGWFTMTLCHKFWPRSWFPTTTSFSLLDWTTGGDTQRRLRPSTPLLPVQPSSLLDEALWLAVPKKKVTRSKKRMKTTRQNRIKLRRDIIIDPRTGETTLRHKMPYNWKDYLPDKEE